MSIIDRCPHCGGTTGYEFTVALAMEGCWGEEAECAHSLKPSTRKMVSCLDCGRRVKRAKAEGRMPEGIYDIRDEMKTALAALRSGELVVVDRYKLDAKLPNYCPCDETEGEWQSPVHFCEGCLMNQRQDHNRLDCWIAYLTGAEEE